MKELTIEEKAKAYDIAVERATKFKKEYLNYKELNVHKGVIEAFDGIFHEPQESEDEGILRRIINIVDEYSAKHQIDNTDCIDWLEKQGEHANFRNKIKIGDKVTRNEDGVLVNLSQLKRVAKKDEKQGEQKSFDKYKVGDTIYYNSFGRLVNFVIANIVEDGTDNPMYEDKDGNSVFQNDIVEQKPADKVEPKFKKE